MNKEEIFKNINYPMARRLIKATNNIKKEDSFFDRNEESLLSMLIFYFTEVEKKTTISELFHSIDIMLECINDIKEFNNLFINIKDENLRSVYTKSSFCATYNEYIENSVGMTEEEANKKNGWILGSFDLTLHGLKCRFKKSDIDRLIMVEETGGFAMCKTQEIINGKVDLGRENKDNLYLLLKLFNDVINDKLVDEYSLNGIYLAKDRVERVLSKKQLTFISRVKALFKIKAL